jgi:hypothetical protein
MQPYGKDKQRHEKKKLCYLLYRKAVSLKTFNSSLLHNKQCDKPEKLFTIQISSVKGGEN